MYTFKRNGNWEKNWVIISNTCGRENPMSQNFIFRNFCLPTIFCVLGGHLQKTLRFKKEEVKKFLTFYGPALYEIEQFCGRV